MLLEVKDLSVDFQDPFSGDKRALFNVNFNLDAGQRLGIVGESGAGKSVLGFALLNLIAEPGFISGGEVLFKGEAISSLSFEQLSQIRGNKIAMIFQDPMMTLNPVLTIETQMVETILAHQDISFEKAKAIALEKLRLVQIPTPEKRITQYPFELSGGMRQRVVIAIALVNEPQLIIADEPTTALDVTIQAEIMKLLLDLCQLQNLALILITHDLAVVSQITEKALVLYAGKVVEYGPTDDLIQNPKHPYTQGLIQALPQMAVQQSGAKKRLNQIPGNMPELGHLIKGCAFSPRCAHKKERCEVKPPPLISTQRATGQTQVACYLAESEQEAI